MLDLANGLRRDDPGEYARLMRAFERLSASGPPRNGRRSRALALAIERAAGTRWRYLNDKRRGALRIVEDQ